MAIASLFMTTTGAEAPLDGSKGTDATGAVSDFLTVQSLANFGAMTGSITLAWRALQTLNRVMFSASWVPFAFALVFGIVSVVTSIEGLKKDGKLQWGTGLSASFIALINALVLASAVIGATAATG